MRKFNTEISIHEKHPQARTSNQIMHGKFRNTNVVQSTSAALRGQLLFKKIEQEVLTGADTDSVSC